jgi:argininosuccinate lyase
MAMLDPGGHLGVGDRFAEGPAPELIQSAFALEAGYGPLLHHGMSLADLAHAVMLIEARIVPADAGARLLAALLELHAIPAEAFPFDPAHGDAYTNREHLLRQRAPDAAGWLQAGRARREASTVGYALAVRAGLLSVAEALLALMHALLDRATDHLDTLMPDYTYLQAAQPTTLAHYLLTFAQPMTRDLARLKLAFDHADHSPAGVGSTNGSRLPIDRERLAELLGFQGLAVHTRDAMWQPDSPVEVMAALTALLINVDRLAEDLQIWATAEFGYVELSDRHSRVSVIMPQKKNPYSLSYARGVARDTIGKLAGAAALQATPSGQIDNRIFAYGGTPQALGQAERALRLMAGVVADLTVNAEVMRRRAGQDYIGATDLAEAIMVAGGHSARTAHRIVGRAVRLAIERDIPLDAALLDEAAQAVVERPLGLSDTFVAESVDPRRIVDSRTTIGGAAARPVRAMLERFASVAAAYGDWLAEQQRWLAAAEQTLIETARALAATG